MSIVAWGGVLKIILFANTEWYLYNFRRSLALSLRKSGHDVLLVSPPGPYGRKLLELGFRWIPAPMQRRSLNPLSEMFLLVWLIRLFRSESVDLVHGFTIKCAVYAALAARFGGVRYCVSAVAGMGYVFTNNDVRARLLRPFVSAMMRAAIGGAGRRLILQNPDDVEHFLRADLIDIKFIKLIPSSGVDCTAFSPLVSAPKREKFRVVLPARILWDKGVSEYVEAARCLIGQGLDIEFLLAGAPDPGNPASVPDSVLQEWEAEGVVKCLGHVDDMPSLFQSVDVVVLPSYREGLPRGLIEAGACGVALVTTDVPGCREVVEDEVNGLLVPVKDSHALGAAISRLFNDPVLRLKLGTEARRKVLREYEDGIVFQRTLNVYNELIGVSPSVEARFL